MSENCDKCRSLLLFPPKPKHNTSNSTYCPCSTITKKKTKASIRLLSHCPPSSRTSVPSATPLLCCDICFSLAQQVSCQRTRLHIETSDTTWKLHAQATFGNLKYFFFFLLRQDLSHTTASVSLFGWCIKLCPDQILILDVWRLAVRLTWLSK